MSNEYIIAWCDSAGHICMYSISISLIACTVGAVSVCLMYYVILLSGPCFQEWQWMVQHNC